MKRIIKADTNDDISRKNIQQGLSSVNKLKKDMQAVFDDIELLAQYPVYDQLELDDLYNELDYCIRQAAQFLEDNE